MRVETERFGALEVDSEAIIEIIEGLYGFEHAKRFCIIDHDGRASFRWLQCLDAPALAFVVINPYDFFANYEVELDDQEAEAIELRTPDDAVILNLVTLGATPADATANLVGPIILNAKNRKAKQVVLANQAYTTKHRLLPELNGAQAPLGPHSRGEVGLPVVPLDSTPAGERAP
jgi:flagellar assembly factor FliW